MRISAIAVLAVVIAGCGATPEPRPPREKRVRAAPVVPDPVSRSATGGARAGGRKPVHGHAPAADVSESFLADDDVSEPFLADDASGVSERFPADDTLECCVMRLPTGDFYALGVGEGDCKKAAGRWTSGSSCERVCCSDFETERVDWRARASCVKTGEAEYVVVADVACAP